MDEALTPKQIVEKLDLYIIGQTEAKRAVAIALRNRWRRQRVPKEMGEEISPKNIIMIGPTGVGKTEIARRLAKLDNSPFLKVEASKFTEVGYVGRDVESMIRDLVEIAVSQTKSEEHETVKGKAAQLAEERLLDILLPLRPVERTVNDLTSSSLHHDPDSAEEDSTREKLRHLLREGKLDQRMVEVEVTESKPGPMIEVFSAAGVEDLGFNMKDLLGNIFPQKRKRRKVKVSEAIEIITQEEAQRLIDMDKVVKTAVERVEQAGIIFLDEIDKIVGTDTSHGPDVSRGGVQRDLLPIVEGSTVNTRYGMVRTDHILFIAAGAFSMSKPSDYPGTSGTLPHPGGVGFPGEGRIHPHPDRAT